MSENARRHWETVYETKADSDVSWFEDAPLTSLEFIARAGSAAAAGIIDIGGGASRLPDRLLDLGLVDIAVLDLSAAALQASQARLASRARDVSWIVADVVTWRPDREFGVWHDRAALHFLTAPDDQRAYVERLQEALTPGGYAIIGTFAPDGPERCSGLPVARHDAISIGRLLGEQFTLIETRRHAHATPWGSEQRFQFSMFRRA